MIDVDTVVDLAL